MVQYSTKLLQSSQSSLQEGITLVSMKLPFDEMLDSAGKARPHYQIFHNWLKQQSDTLMGLKRAEADLIFRRVGITFAVYGDDLGSERTIPFDQVPRIFTAKEWAQLEAGLRQRVTALNRFIYDVYHEEEIIKSGIIPAEQIFNNAQYRPEMRHVSVPRNIYAQIAGIDIVRAGEGEFYVLEDNLRVPSGVSYMVEDRKMMMRLFPDLFQKYRVAPVEHYPDLLLECLKSVKPNDVKKPNVVLLTPGMYNSAYFEHSYLAQQMGVELVEGKDLFVKNEQVFMRTTQGPERVDVIYRRVDDDFLDPLAFRSDSTLGVAGLLSAYRAGNVTLANAIGTGIADDKSIYPYVPRMIEFYLGEQPSDSKWKFQQGSKTITVQVSGRYSANHTGIRLDAALKHIGIASLPYFVARHALQDGRLIQVLPDWYFKTYYSGDAWLLYPPTRHLPPKLSVFIQFLAEKLAGSRPFVDAWYGPQCVWP